jgi:hypothetical protein
MAARSVSVAIHTFKCWTLLHGGAAQKVSRAAAHVLITPCDTSAIVQCLSHSRQIVLACARMVSEPKTNKQMEKFSATKF